MEANKESVWDKMKQHYDSRHEFMAKRFDPVYINMMGPPLFMMLSVSIVGLALGVFVPINYSHNFWEQMVWMGLASSVAFQVLLNYWLVQRTFQFSKVTAEIAQRKLEGKSIEVGIRYHCWKYCSICQTSMPPRAFHCSLCQSCVLKQDHHCFFVGNCIGFHNQRYFLVLIFYLSVALVLALYQIWLYIYTQFSDQDVVTTLMTIFLFPVRWYKGELALQHCFFLLFIYFLLPFLGFAAYTFASQVVLVFRGQTMYELEHNLRLFRHQSLWSRLREVFGPYWFINFIWPLKTLPQGDGYHWSSDRSL